MIIFTPNTVIKSADVNLNFANHQSSLDNLDTRVTYIEPYPFACGTVGGELTAGSLKSLPVHYAAGLTVNTYNVVLWTSGYYIVYIQQLWNTGAPAVNFFIRKNGASLVHAWLPPYVQTDAIASCLHYFAAGDTIDFYIDQTLANNWTGDHSSWYVSLQKRTG